MPMATGASRSPGACACFHHPPLRRSWSTHGRRVRPWSRRRRLRRSTTRRRSHHGGGLFSFGASGRDQPGAPMLPVSCFSLVVSRRGLWGWSYRTSSNPTTHPDSGLRTRYTSPGMCADRRRAPPLRQFRWGPRSRPSSGRTASLSGRTVMRVRRSSRWFRAGRDRPRTAHSGVAIEHQHLIRAPVAGRAADDIEVLIRPYRHPVGAVEIPVAIGRCCIGVIAGKQPDVTVLDVVG